VAVALWKKRLLAMAVSLVVTLILGELGLRALGVSFQDFYQADPDRGVAHRPGARGWFRREGRQYIVINQDGFRDRDHPRTKPPNTVRIAVLGDSFTEALQVPLDQSFCAVIERELAGCPALRGRSVEVLNFGVSDYGTAQELLTLRQRVWDYAPDIVLLAFYAGNDIWDNARALKQSPEVPYFVLRDGALVLDDAFRQRASQYNRQSRVRGIIRLCVESSRLLQLVRQTWGVTLARIRRRSEGGGSTQSGQEFGASWYQNPIYKAPGDPAWQGAWDVTERLIVQIRDEVVRKGAKFLVVTLSTGAQSHPDPAVRERYQRMLGVPDLFYPDRRVRELGDREGFEVLNLAPSFQRFARENHVFLHGFGPTVGSGHWNASGHNLAGRLIAQWICDVGLPD
jgi:hypothetical protein